MSLIPSYNRKLKFCLKNLSHAEKREEDNYKSFFANNKNKFLFYFLKQREKNPFCFCFSSFHLDLFGLSKKFFLSCWSCFFYYFFQYFSFGFSTAKKQAKKFMAKRKKQKKKKKKKLRREKHFWLKKIGKKILFIKVLFLFQG